MLDQKIFEMFYAAAVCCYWNGDREAGINEIRPLLAKLVEVIGDNEWIAGPNLTWLDFSFAEILSMLDSLSEGLFFCEFPTMQAYWDRFIALPKLAEAWTDDEKCFKSPYFNKMAKLLNV